MKKKLNKILFSLCLKALASSQVNAAQVRVQPKKPVQRTFRSDFEYTTKKIANTIKGTRQNAQTAHQTSNKPPPPPGKGHEVTGQNTNTRQNAPTAPLLPSDNKKRQAPPPPGRGHEVTGQKYNDLDHPDLYNPPSGRGHEVTGQNTNTRQNAPTAPLLPSDNKKRQAPPPPGRGHEVTGQKYNDLDHPDLYNPPSGRGHEVTGKNTPSDNKKRQAPPPPITPPPPPSGQGHGVSEKQATSTGAILNLSPERQEQIESKRQQGKPPISPKPTGSNQSASSGKSQSGPVVKKKEDQFSEKQATSTGAILNLSPERQEQIESKRQQGKPPISPKPTGSNQSASSAPPPPPPLPPPGKGGVTGQKNAGGQPTRVQQDDLNSALNSALEKRRKAQGYKNSSGKSQSGTVVKEKEDQPSGQGHGVSEKQATPHSRSAVPAATQNALLKEIQDGVKLKHVENRDAKKFVPENNMNKSIEKSIAQHDYSHSNSDSDSPVKEDEWDE